MKTLQVTLIGESPYSQSKGFLNRRDKKESAEEHEKRCWSERAHVTETGQLFVPPMALSFSLQSTAKLLGMQVSGKGRSTYTKHFLSGLLITDPLLLTYDGKPVTKQQIVDGWHNWYFVNADGKRGSGTRVWRCYPEVPTGWRAEATIFVLDDTITKEVLEEHLIECGRFRGLGRFRPENGGFFGRFSVDNFRWQEEAPKARARRPAANSDADVALHS